MYGQAGLTRDSPDRSTVSDRRRPRRVCHIELGRACSHTVQYGTNPHIGPCRGLPPLRPGHQQTGPGLAALGQAHATIHPCTRLCACGARRLRPDRDDARHSPPPQSHPDRLDSTDSNDLPAWRPGVVEKPLVDQILRSGLVRVSAPFRRKRRNRTPTVQTALPGLAARRLRFATNVYGQARVGSCWRLLRRPPSTGAGRTRVIRSQTQASGQVRCERVACPGQIRGWLRRQASQPTVASMRPGMASHPIDVPVFAPQPEGWRVTRTRGSKRDRICLQYWPTRPLLRSCLSPVALATRSHDPNPSQTTLVSLTPPTSRPDRFSPAAPTSQGKPFDRPAPTASGGCLTSNTTEKHCSHAPRRRHCCCLRRRALPGRKA